VAGKGLGALEEWGIEVRLMDIECDGIVCNGKGDLVVAGGVDTVHVTIVPGTLMYAIKAPAWEEGRHSVSSVPLDRLKELVFTTGTYHGR